MSETPANVPSATAAERLAALVRSVKELESAVPSATVAQPSQEFGSQLHWSFARGARPAHEPPGYCWYIFEARGGCIAGPLLKENAALIVAAVNVHADLLAVLKAISADASAYPWHLAVRAAIAKAEGR